MAVIEDDLMGDFWPHAQPGGDGANYGTTRFSPEGSFTIRTYQTFTLIYTVGEFGLDDTGAIKIVTRWMSDNGGMQCSDPAAPNYVRAVASNGAALKLYMEPYPHQRPWYKGLRISVAGGYMSPGDTITVILGDKSGGSPGYRLQSFCESAHEFRVLADVCATGVFLPVGRHAIQLTAGSVARWVLVGPTLRRVSEAFTLGIRGEDAWGNASDQLPPGLRLVADGDIHGLPTEVRPEPGQRGIRVPGLHARQAGTYRFRLLSADGTELARSNPLVVREDGPASYWGDLHGQSAETVGINPIREYLEFARDVAFLDVTSHQANDFQITNAFWQQINALTAEMNQDGQFTVFPGYEWSANTPIGGDHNVFFAQEGRAIRRSSHALLTDRSDIESDANTLPALFEALEEEDCVLFAHVGGRPADISAAEHPRLRTAVEVHSDWGTFEWIMTDAFALGYRVGLVCNSDGHKGAPGACYPGASEFGAYSGLTCFVADTLSRPAIFDAMRKRRHYGTTGCRMQMEVIAHLGDGGAVYAIDPRVKETEPLTSRSAQMGDIVRVDQDHVDLEIALETHAPIERVDVLNGAQTIETLRPYAPAPEGRLRVLWQGAEYRGRGRTTHWSGKIAFDQAQIQDFRKINIWNLDRQFEQQSAHSIVFDAVTTGNFCGCDIWLKDQTGEISIETGLVSGRFPLSDVTDQEICLEAGGLERKIRLYRLPETLACCSLHQRCRVPLKPDQDNPLWIRVTTEDGFVAWSSPIYCLR